MLDFVTIMLCHFIKLIQVVRTGQGWPSFKLLLVARGLPRYTENNPDHWEILLEFLSAVLCQHFPIILKDPAIVNYVTMAPYNSKSMFAWARSFGAFSKSTRFLYQVHSYYHRSVFLFAMLLLLDVHYKADKEESDCLIRCFDMK